MRGHNTFLERHGDGWRFRVRIPSKLAAFINRSDLRLTLGRIDRREALRRARLMRVDAEQLFVELGTTMDVAKAQQGIDAWKNRWLAEIASRLVTEGRIIITEKEMKGEEGLAVDLMLRMAMWLKMQTLDARIKRALAGFEPERLELGPIIQAGLHHAGVSDNTPPHVRAALTAAVLKAYAEGQRQIDAIGQGDLEAIAAALSLAGVPMDDLNSMAGAPPAAPAAQAKTDPAARPSSPARTQSETAEDGETFEASWADFVRDKIDVTQQWKRSRRPELTATLRIWLWIIGQVSPSDVTKAELAKFRSVFLQLPADYSRAPAYADTPAEDLIRLAQSETPKAVRVSAKTLNKHMSTLKSYFVWLFDQGRLSTDPAKMFSGLYVKPKKKGRGGRGERNEYTDDEFRAMFSSPVWMGRKSERILTQPGDYIRRDSLYWAPLLAAYQGARREELSQVRVRHFVQIEGVWLLNLNAVDLTLKADDGFEDEGSRRILPLHRDILKLGFLEACIFGRDGDDQLFPELSNSNASEAFGAALGRRFGNYQQAMRFFGPGVEGGLHRFRHSFTTRLENTAAKSAFIEELTGHEGQARRSERGRYTKSIHIQNLKRTIDMLELPIDVDALLAAVQRCSTNGRRP